MSYYAEEAYVVYNERDVRARKEHRCCACDVTIKPGHVYKTVFTLYDGAVDTYKRCLRCQAIHEHLRTMGEVDDWPDEELGCGHEYTKRWGVEPPPEIAALAFVTADEMQQKRTP